MKREAESHAAEDKARRELVEIKNRAEQIVHSTRRSLEEHGAKVSPEVRSNIESALSNVEGKVKGDDKTALERALKELETASMELGKVIYQQEAAKQAGSTGASPSSDAPRNTGKDDVVDAEFEVKDE